MRSHCHWLLGTALCALFASTAAGCGDDGTGSGGSGSTTGSGGVDDVVFEGGASDEALRELQSLTPSEDPSQRASFSTPEEAATLGAAAPVAFAWALPQEGARTPASPRLDLAPQSGTAERAGIWLLGGLFAWVPDAHAHGDPVNGRAFHLSFSGSDGAVVLEVFTTFESYTPDQAAWDRLVAASDPLTASLVSAVFEGNRVSQDGGPFVGGQLTFSIQ